MSAKELTEADLRERSARTYSVGSSDPTVLAAEIAAHHRITVADLLGPRRLKRLMAGRHELYRILRELGWSYPDIGQFVGGRDHTTVLAALRPSPRKQAIELGRRARSRGRPFPKPHWLGPTGPLIDGLLTAAASGL
jgi:hypothetical protein